MNFSTITPIGACAVIQFRSFDKNYKPKPSEMIPVGRACNILGCSRATFYRAYAPKLTVLRRGKENYYWQDEVENIK